MMKKWYFLNIFFVFTLIAAGQDITIKSSIDKEPVSFATISFGNGKGTFADVDGVFRFSKKLYQDVDSLTISSVGYDDLNIAATAMKETLLMNPATDALETIVITAPLQGDFKDRKIKENGHDNYFNTWLPTVESEIAVRFNRYDDAPTQISSLKLPIIIEDSQSSKKGKKRRFSTMFRVSFYDVDTSGAPSYKSYYPTQTFIITHKDEEVYELDINALHINIPKNGIYAAIQVLGYTKPDGNLINAKKYREIRTRRGVEKISTTYRPLLPFTPQENSQPIYVRRIFFKDKKWMRFNLKYNRLSKLVRDGNNHYGMGATFKVFYKDE